MPVVIEVGLGPSVSFRFPHDRDHFQGIDIHRLSDRSHTGRAGAEALGADTSAV